MKTIVTVDSSSVENKLPTFRQNEYGFNINFSVVDDLDAVVDLTDTTVKFQIKNINSTTKKVDGTCAIDVAASGTCHYSVIAADFDTVGLYEAELEVTTISSKRIIKLGMFAVLGDI